MISPSPLLLSLKQYQYLDNRNKKLLKLCLIKQKSQAQGKKQKLKTSLPSNALHSSIIVDILCEIDQNSFENIIDSEQGQSEFEEFESEVHNIFSNYKEKASLLFADEVDDTIQCRDLLKIKNINDSDYVINFKALNQQISDLNSCENLEKISPVVNEKTSGNPNNDLNFNNNNRKEQYFEKHQQLSEHQQHNQNQTNLRMPFQLNLQQNQHQNSHIQGEKYTSGHNLLQQQSLQNQRQIKQQRIQFKQAKNQMNSQYNITIIEQKTINNSQNHYQFNTENNFSNQAQKAPRNKIISQFNESANIGSNISNDSIDYNNLLSLQNNLNSCDIKKSNPNSKYCNGMSGEEEQFETQSIQNKARIVSPQKKKSKLSFMQYYHSMPVKSPTNILQKYMKRKK